MFDPKDLLPPPPWEGLLLDIIGNLSKHTKSRREFRKGDFVFYDRPTSKAKLIILGDGSRPNLAADEIGAEWISELVELIEDRGNRWVVRTDKGSIFEDKPSDFV